MSWKIPDKAAWEAGEPQPAATPEVLKPGDILAVRGNSLTSELIRLGEALDGKPNVSNHIAVMHHWDGNVPWGLEGKPGGVGWVDLRGYLRSEMTLNNCGQPGRTDAQRAVVADYAVSLLGTKYDWEAIGGDTLAALHVRLWHLDFPHGLAPGEVVCSSYAAWLYERPGWDHPGVGDERDCEPGDWDAFVLDRGYNLKIGA